jgi:hypothetical protein
MSIHGKKRRHGTSLLFVLCSLLFVSCSLLFSTAFLQCAKLTPEQQASLAAEGYYRHLIAGEYEQFLQGRVGADSLSDDYREQLLTAYRQFVAQQQEKHDGIADVTVSNVRTDSLCDYTSVFLLLSFRDSTQEEIIVPMVDTGNGRWRMR